jgi:pimeloyl-ACP methyl ester carboxylesterase
MPFADNDGVRIHYEVEGEGPPLVLCHGLFGSLEQWRIWGYVETLKNYYQLVLIDARGHGASDKPHDHESYRTEHMVADVVSVLDDLNIEKSHFLGYSMGGQIGWCIGRFAPNRFYSLIIGGMAPYERDPDIPDPDVGVMVPLLRKGNAAVIVAFEELFGEKLAPGIKNILMNNDPEAIIARLRRVEHVELDETISTTTLPCLLYMGELESSYTAAKKCIDVLPNVTFVSVPNLNHEQVSMRSDIVLPHILKFLENITET